MFSARDNADTHTHTYASYTRGVERERGRLHIRVTTISRTYRRQTFGKETDGENESSSRGWMGNADAAPSKEARTSALWIHTHTHAHNEGAIANHRLKFQAREFSIFSIPPPCHFPTHFSPPLEIRRNGWIQPGVVNFFFLLLFLSSQPLGWIDRLFFSIRVCTSCVEELICRRGTSASQKWPSLGDRVVSNK